jgi:AraC-like DNA-binding protein
MNISPRIYLYKRVLIAKLFIDGHYDENIDLNNIAGEASFSKFHFLRIFKNIYGKTPHQYLTWVRIEKAKQLLRTGMTIANVCCSVGFDSISTFTMLFKRVVLATPAVYQQIEVERKEQMSKTPLNFIPNCFAEKNGWAKV